MKEVTVRNGCCLVLEPIRRILTLTRLNQFDTATPKGHSQERYRRIILTAFASVIARGITALSILISVPLTLNYLGVERYGVWMTLSSFTALLSFADLGLGSGLLNAISVAKADEDRVAAREYVSSAFLMLSSLALVLAAVFAVFYRWLDWQRIFNITSLSTVAEVGPAMIVFVICLLVNIPFGIVQRVQIGYQEGFANSVWQALGSILSFATLVTAIYLRAELPWLVLALVGVPAFTALLQTVIVFGFTHGWLRPHWSTTSYTAASRVLRLGFMFFIIQITSAFAFASDNIVAAQVLGPEAVTQYSVPMRLFSIPTMILGILLTPFWPAYTEAIARKDMLWVENALRRALWLALFVTGVPSLVFVLFGPQIISLWVGQSVQVPFLLLLGLGIWTVLAGITNCVYGIFLNGAGASAITFQVICALLLFISALPAKIVLARTIGISGIIWGVILAVTVFDLLPTFIYVPKLLVKFRLEK